MGALTGKITKNGSRNDRNVLELASLRHKTATEAAMKYEPPTKLSPKSKKISFANNRKSKKKLAMTVHTESGSVLKLSNEDHLTAFKDIDQLNRFTSRQLNKQRQVSIGRRNNTNSSALKTYEESMPDL